MPTSTTITDETGQQLEVNIFTLEELKTFLNDTTGAGKKASIGYMRQLGQLAHIAVKMSPDEREEWILARYTELGVGPGAAAKPKAGLKPAATSNGIKPAAKPAAAAQGLKVKAAGTGAPAVQAEAPAAATERVNGVTASADSAAVLKALQQVTALVGEQGELLVELKAQLIETQGLNEELLAIVKQQDKTLLDTHFIVRVLAKMNDLSEEEILAFSDDCYDKLVTEPAEEEEEVADEEQLEGNA